VSISSTNCDVRSPSRDSLGCSPSVANAHSVLAMSWGLKSPRTATALSVSPSTSTSLGFSLSVANAHSVLAIF